MLMLLVSVSAFDPHDRTDLCVEPDRKGTECFMATSQIDASSKVPECELMKTKFLWIFCVRANARCYDCRRASSGGIDADRTVEPLLYEVTVYFARAEVFHGLCRAQISVLSIIMFIFFVQRFYRYVITWSSIHRDRNTARTGL